MKTVNVLLLILLVSLFNSCSLFPKQPTVLTTADTLAITNAICSSYENAKNVEISEEYVNWITLFWNDPAGTQRPTINVKSDCWKIRFDHAVYDTDSVYLYTDFYELVFPKNDSLVFRYDKFRGPQYHGSTYIMIKGIGDNRYPNIHSPLVRTKNDYIRIIERVLFKNR